MDNTFGKLLLLAFIKLVNVLILGGFYDLKAISTVVSFRIPTLRFGKTKGLLLFGHASCCQLIRFGSAISITMLIF